MRRDVDRVRCHSELVARSSDEGFTVVELMIAVALIGLIAGLSITNYLGYVEKARVARAVAEIAGIAKILDGTTADDNAQLPTSLAEIEQVAASDPWGNPYQYLRIAGGGPSAIGHARKDGFMVPINTDYDLYSMGRDGKTKAPLTAPESRDDVIRAANGSYIGLAELF